MKSRKLSAMGVQEDFDEAAKLAASGSNEGLKKISQDQQKQLYGWFKQVKPGALVFIFPPPPCTRHLRRATRVFCVVVR